MNKNIVDDDAVNVCRRTNDGTSAMWGGARVRDAVGREETRRAGCPAHKFRCLPALLVSSSPPFQVDECDGRWQQ